MDIQLYDMEEQEWRKGNFKRGDSWRSSEIYQCQICQVRTNKWIMGGSMGMGPRILCPGSMYDEHIQLENFITRLDRLQEEIDLYGGIITQAINAGILAPTNPNPKQVIQTRTNEQDLLNLGITSVRAKFVNLDDLVGFLSTETPTTLPFISSSKYFRTIPLSER